MPCVANALESNEINTSRLPKDVRWPSLVFQACDLEWTSKLPAYCDSGYELRHQLTSGALRDEGKTMKNCVMKYDCCAPARLHRSTRYGIPSVSMRVATAVIMQDRPECIWRLSQVKGPLNREVDDLIREIASRIASFYNLNEGKAGELTD